MPPEPTQKLAPNSTLNFNMAVLLSVLPLPPAFLNRYFYGPVTTITGLAYYVIAWIVTMHFIAELASSPIPEVLATVSSALGGWVLISSSDWVLGGKVPEGSDKL